MNDVQRSRGIWSRERKCDDKFHKFISDYNYSVFFLYKPVVRLFGVIKWSQYFSFFDFFFSQDKSNPESAKKLTKRIKNIFAPNLSWIKKDRSLMLR